MYDGQRVFNERRKGPDFWVKWIKWAGYFSWVIAFAIIILTDRAKPPVETFFDRYFHIQLKRTWDIYLMRYAFLLLLVLFFICVFTIIVNFRRHRRKTDRYNPSIIILSVLSLLGIIIYLYTF